MRRGNPRPDFIIGGAPRSGTTFLARLLHAVRDVYLAQPLIPEPKVLIGRKPPTREEVEARYAACFEGVPEGVLCGEKTSGYLESPLCADRIQNHLPDVRLIFVLRHPVHRAFSNYLWTRKNGFEDRPFEEVWDLDSDMRPHPLEETHPEVRLYDYLDRSRYGARMEVYRKRFPDSQLYWMVLEAFLADPAAEWKSLGNFLGRDLGSLQPDALGPVNTTDGVQGSCPPGLKARVAECLKADLEIVYGHLPKARQYWDPDLPATAS